MSKPADRSAFRIFIFFKTRLINEFHDGVRTFMPYKEHKKILFHLPFLPPPLFCNKLSLPKQKIFKFREWLLGVPHTTLVRISMSCCRDTNRSTGTCNYSVCAVLIRRLEKQIIQAPPLSVRLVSNEKRK
jgi:hypothetical protein